MKFLKPVHRSIIIASLLILCFKSNSSVHNKLPDMPMLTISGTTQQRSVTNEIFRFNITLNSKSAQTVSVAYKPVEATAKNKIDFIAATGTATIAAGQQQTYIDILVKGDSLHQNDLQFTIELSSPQNCVLNKTSATATIISANGTNLQTDTSGYRTPAFYTDKKLVWSDEFNGPDLDTSKWNFETGGNGWGNQELENYTSGNNNLFISNGILVIEARKENMGKNLYTSARINTKRKYEFLYGRIDIRAKLPVAKGLWPALWMLGANNSIAGWPKCGETDIMELIGTYPSRVYSTMHWLNSSNQPTHIGGQYQLTGEDFSDKFHVFSLIWEKDSLQFYVDDNLFFSFSKKDTGIADYPYNAPSYFIFNVAVGGLWPGSPDETTVFPQRMFVDYIRVFQ